MKYYNKKTTVDGITFDSKKEAHRWWELKLMERAGEITELNRQQKFILIPSQKAQNRTERAVTYVADFCYLEDGKLVVEDTKGFKTKDYIIKRKLMLKRYGIQVREI